MCCYCLHHVPSDNDWINCFFPGSSCTGSYPVYLQSSITKCVLRNYNLVNNSDDSGYFYVSMGNRKILKDSVISFVSNTPKWLYYIGSSVTLVVEDTFVMATCEFQTETQLESTSIKRVVSASTYKPFETDRPVKNTWGYQYGSHT